MSSVDIWEFPFCQNKRYLLMVQDYFYKWLEDIPLHNLSEKLWS